MNNTESDTVAPPDFYERYSTFSDSRIREILKNHKNYQEAAINAAVKIAIERKLIHSEQDLLAPEYQYQPSAGLSFFPVITDYYQHKKVVASIFRVLFFYSLIPIIFGILKHSEGQITLSYISIGFGLIWALFCFLLLKTQKTGLIVTMVVIICFASFGVGYRFFDQEMFRTIDLVILSVSILVPAYFLKYLMQLVKNKPEQF